MPTTELGGSSKPIFRLCYISRVAAPITEAEFAAIGVAGRHNNARLDITSVLMHTAGFFVHMLEGEQEQVQSLCWMIAGDPRHGRLSIIGYEFAEERHFSGLPIGCCDVARRELPEEWPAKLFGPELLAAQAATPEAFRQVSDFLDELSQQKFSEQRAKATIAA